jgi:predicted dehydrogenase
MNVTDKVRFAQIGIDHTHASGYLDSLLLMPEVEIVALYDARPDVMRPLVQPALRDVPLYGDLDMLLRQEQPEAVLIALPNDATPQAIVRAAENGAHVYAEKPCARTAREFLPALEAMRKAGVQFATGYLRRSSPVGQAIKDMVDGGLLGRLTSIEARWITTSVTVRDPTHYYFSREQSGGGILHWLGCHWLDFMRWATSAEVVEVAAVLDTLSVEAIGVEDTAALSLRYSGGWVQQAGMVGSLHCAYVTDRATDQLFFGLRGTLGWVEWPKSGPELVAHSTHPAWAAAPTRILRFEPEPVGGYGGAQGILALQRFIASFREGIRPVFVGQDALRILQVLDAAHESAASGKRVSLSK